MINNTERRLFYPVALLLSIGSRKSCEILANAIKKNGDLLRRLLKNPPTTLQEFVAIAKELFGFRNVYLIIDDVIILKIYSLLIEGTSDNYDPSTGNTGRSLCAVVGLLTDGISALPISHELWTAKEFDAQNYATKVELAQRVIMQILPLIKISMLLADGLYATYQMFSWLNAQKINFEMRFHSNRIVDCKGQSHPLKEHPSLRLNKSRERRTVLGSWKGISLYFTALLRWTKKSGSIIVYLVSNLQAEPRQHARFYKYRWHIEKFFRTAKQKLGFSDCQSRKIAIQKNHILNTFVAYAILQLERKRRKLKNPEAALRRIKLKSCTQIINHWSAPGQIFGPVFA